LPRRVFPDQLFRRCWSSNEWPTLQVDYSSATWTEISVSGTIPRPRNGSGGPAEMACCHIYSFSRCSRAIRSRGCTLIIGSNLGGADGIYSRQTFRRVPLVDTTDGAAAAFVCCLKGLKVNVIMVGFLVSRSLALPTLLHSLPLEPQLHPRQAHE